MNKDLLKSRAIELERLLLNYSKKDNDAFALLQMLTVLINDSKAKNVETPLEWRDIPGGRLFSEGNLAAFSDLEQAFAEFRIELIGGETSALSRLRTRHRE